MNIRKKKNQTQTVGSPAVITEAEIQQCLDHVQAIATVLAPYAVTLTKAERRASSRYRKEGDTVIPVLARLAKAAGVDSTALSVDTMQNLAGLASALQPLQTQVKTLSDTIGDTVLSAHGGAWHTATTLHGALARLAPRNPALRRDMEVVASAFSNRRKASAAAAVAKKATTNATPAASVEAPAPHAQPATTTAAATAPAAAATTGGNA